MVSPLFPSLADAVPRASFADENRKVAVVVGRGKSGWNRLRSKSASSSSSASASSSQSRAQRLADSTNLRSREPPNAEQCYSAECAQLRSQRRAERAKNKQRASAEALARASAISSSLEFEESGVAATESDVGRAGAEDQAATAKASSGSAPAAATAAAASKPATPIAPSPPSPAHDDVVDEEEDDEHGPMEDMLAGAGKFLLAGGMAGAGASHFLSLPSSLGSG